MPKMWANIEFEAPHAASNVDIKEFIIEWLECGGGCRHPADPLFHSLANVKVSKLSKIKENANNTNKSKSIEVMDYSKGPKS